MPAYKYICINCQTQETRRTAISDHTVLCDLCGHVMVRQDDDFDTLLAQYSESRNKVGEAG
jgi:hypothetical protein